MPVINFDEMVAYEFSNLSKQTEEQVSNVTVLDCKHCNDMRKEILKEVA